MPTPLSRMTSSLLVLVAARSTISSGPASRWDSSVRRDVPHLVERVGGVRDQLADRDLAALVERVRQQVEELLDLGLERELLPFSVAVAIIVPQKGKESSRARGSCV